MGAGQIIATDLSAYRLDWAKRCGADEVINVSTTNPEERIDRIRELTNGRGADVVLHMANTPKSFVEGIEMLKRGGMMLEMGNFADTGEISLNVHRHVCSKNIRLVGLTNHPSTGYGPALRLLERYADRYPFAEMVTHEFGLHQADDALHTSMDPRSMPGGDRAGVDSGVAEPGAEGQPQLRVLAGRAEQAQRDRGRLRHPTGADEQVRRRIGDDRAVVRPSPSIP